MELIQFAGIQGGIMDVFRVLGIEFGAVSRNYERIRNNRRGIRLELGTILGWWDFVVVFIIE